MTSRTRPAHTATAGTVGVLPTRLEPSRLGPPSPEEDPEEAAYPGGPMSFYEAVGGEPFFRDLVARFYQRVREDPVLLPLYPADDLDGAEERLALFLMQYWGGPTTYSERRGHPRLRMRHAPYPVGTAQIEAWLANMRAALDSMDLDESLAAEFWAYVERAAVFMRNTPA